VQSSKFKVITWAPPRLGPQATLVSAQSMAAALEARRVTAEAAARSAGEHAEALAEALAAERQRT
jgi:hypothetical protein